jgi:magnesium-protoporphyrin IX monomethyl ester (oxidative) cyclase
MRILLFYPPMTIRGDDPTTPGVVPPLGLANVAAYIEKEGYDVAICDALAEGSKIIKRGKNYLRMGLSEKSIVERLRYYRPNIVGISVMFTAFAGDAHNLAAIVKRTFPKTLVVFGGAHASSLPENVLADKNVDVVVIGEGEETFLEIVKRVEKRKKLDNIPGTAIRGENGKIIFNKDRPFIKDLDSLPSPAYHLLPMDLYLENSRQSEASSYVMRSPSFPVVTSRGCPNNCIYCAVPKIWRRRWRPFSAKRVLSEIEFLVRRYGIREIDFLDDNVSTDKRRFKEICRGIIKKNLDIRWTCPNGIAIWTLDKPLLKMMKKSGCYRLTFGIESGCPRTQKFIRKNLDLKKAKKLMKIANSLGMWTFSTYIIGFPYETKEEMEQTFNYAINSASDFVGFIILMCFPGTDITQIMMKEKLIKKTDFRKTTIGALFSGYKGTGTLYFTPAELKHFQSQAHKRLMLSRLFWPITRPAMIFKKVHSLEDLRYTAKIMGHYLYMLFSTIRLGEFKTHRIRQAVDLHLKGIETENR